ncbi:hypothetical protein [Marinobacterium lutimaris]|uniref:Uncharacterized protein n=1 Tax=Marinobacterium lutimaris TaxID=568106 RepID=A0A1H5YDP0_9GAMM|nr:hypothetical protein [Marinobacterium lutimaris]SEG21845.1 hypothetical protein SAMN05444390_1011708 [Marinobacterium lutimaris]
MALSDDYIESLFQGTNFGEQVNGSIAEKRKLLSKSLRNQLDGYWSGRTIYQIMVTGGFLHDAKSSEKKRLTQLGEAFLQESLPCS